MKNLLPKKLSACLKVALSDLDRAKKAGMAVDMTSWYSRPLCLPACTVCLAGAVLARSFDLNLGEWVNPQDLERDGFISQHDRRRLLALDYLRIGNLLIARRMFDPNYDASDSESSLPRLWLMQESGYEDTAAWRRSMDEIYQALREHGL